MGVTFCVTEGGTATVGLCYSTVEGIRAAAMEAMRLHADQIANIEHDMWDESGYQKLANNLKHGEIPNDDDIKYKIPGVIGLAKFSHLYDGCYFSPGDCYDMIEMITIIEKSGLRPDFRNSGSSAPNIIEGHLAEDMLAVFSQFKKLFQESVTLRKPVHGS